MPLPKLPKKLTLALAAAATLAACGGGDALPEAPIKPPLQVTPAAKGVMIDGYVSGATVFCDSNGNGVLDAGELSTTTNSSGGYEIVGGCAASVVGFGGVNVDTGFAFVGQLKSPPGSTVITPLTTLLVGTGLTSTQLSELLGMPAGTDITKIDVANGQHPDLFKKTLAVHQLLDNLVRISTNNDPSADLKTAYSRVATDLSKALTAQSSGTQFIAPTGAVNASLLSTIVKTLPDIVKMNLVPADLDVAVNSMHAQSQQLSTAIITSPAMLVALTTALQDPARKPLDVTATTSYLAMTGDSMAINGIKVGLANFASGIGVAGLDSIGVALSVVGKPASSSVASVALSLTERGGDKRQLQLMLDEVVFAVDAQGVVQVTVPAKTKVYAYGHTANGTEVNLTISDLTFSPIRVVNNGFSLNYNNIVNKVVASTDVAGRTTAERFLNIKGSFDVRLVISGLNIRKLDGTPYAEQALTITNTSKRVNGPAFAGILTVQ